MNNKYAGIARYNIDELKSFLTANKNMIENITIILNKSEFFFKKIDTMVFYYLDRIDELVNFNQRVRIMCKFIHNDEPILLGYLTKYSYLNHKDS